MSADGGNGGVIPTAFRNVAPRLHGNGYAVVPIAPKGHKYLRTDKATGKQRMVEAEGKAPVEPRWQDYGRGQTADDVKRLLRKRPGPDWGCGIITGRIVGNDIDVRHDEAAKEIHNAADRIFGNMPVRYGAAPKRMLVGRTDEPFPKMKTADFKFPGDAEDAKPHKVEVLCDGQQFVAFAVHPGTGKPYWWDGDSPLNIPAADLPLVTREAAAEFVEECEAILLRHGGLRVKKLKGHGEDAPKESGRLRGDPEKCRSALAAIKNYDLDRDDWAYMAYVVKGAMGEEGYKPFLEWSADSKKHHNEQTVRTLWDSTPAPNRVGAGTLFYLAKQRGWKFEDLGRAANLSLDDFYAYMPAHSYIYTPTRAMWPAGSVNARIPPIRVANRKPIPAATWLDRHRPVEQMTWAPGLLMTIADRLILPEGGWIERRGVTCFNLYHPPTIVLGDPDAAALWIDHARLIYPDDAEHIFDWLAHRVQKPEDKINHALVLGGEQGIGKDTLLEPVKDAIGPWNFQEVSPSQVLGRFNGFLKSVVLRINEARDLGEFDRFQFYDHMKAYTAAPPDVLRVDEKHLREYPIVNCCGIIITTNHKTDGIYLPADDRRHYVAWSQLTKEDERFQSDYWRRLWSWYAAGGTRHVAAFLQRRNLSGFDAKAPPPKTAAFWEIADANRPQEEPELNDVLDQLERPNAVTLEQIKDKASDNGPTESGFYWWLSDRKNRRIIPHRLEKCGYVPIRNPYAADGLWKINNARRVIYAKKELTAKEQVDAVQVLAPPVGADRSV